MKDYSFGNFICALRVGRGLSQYQLGALIGVTDKAVSKWENGNAKPRLQTCHRLAAILGVSINELLSCEYQNDFSARKDVSALREKLQHKAQAQLHKAYGQNPPIECWSRLETELAVLKNSEALISIGYLSELAQTAKTAKAAITVRALVPSSFTAWLLGATEVNPLPAHYVCPKCHKVKFCHNVEDGFDLPEETCSCGHTFERNGHNIPFEGYAQSITKLNAMEVNISTSLEQPAVSLLKKYYDSFAKVLPIMIDEPDTPVGPCSFAKYVILPPETSMPILGEDGYLHMSGATYHNRYQNYTSYYFYVSPDESKLERLMLKYRKPFLNELLSTDVIDAAFHNRCKAIPHVTNAIEKTAKINFSLLTRLDGLGHSTGVWEGNGEELVRSGTANIRELVAFREDIWDMIINRVSPKVLSGAGLPLKIMEEVKFGRYQREGMPTEVEQLLYQINMPDWYIDHITKVTYIFPKSHCISYLMRDLALAWYQTRYPEEFDQIQASTYRD